MESYQSHRTKMDPPIVTFALVADSGAARRLRRMVAGTGARVGWLAGTWRELLELAHRAYAPPPLANDWDARFEHALREIPDAFWAESLAVAPEETRATVLDALSEILCSTDPGAPMNWGNLTALSDRAARHLADLARLAGALGGHLPPELAAIRSLLCVEAADALHLIRVHQVDGHPTLSRWQQALVDRLNQDAAAANADAGESTLDLELQRQVCMGSEHAGRGTALRHLQDALFHETAPRVALDGSVQWLAARDFLQEAEVAAGMVQQLLETDPALQPADIGVLLPDSFEYSVAVDDAFRLAGLLSSGLSADWWRRDLGLEWMFHFLYCRQKPAPAMALAVCLSSPLMPWPRELGAALAQQVMDGDYELDAESVQGPAGRRMMELIKEGDRTPQTLRGALRTIPELLTREDRFHIHRERIDDGLRILIGLLETADELDWPVLRRAVRPRFIRADTPADFNQEGVSVWSEGQEPWRPVKHLLVLGFSQGAYPVRKGAGAVFSEPDLEAVRERLGLPVDTPGRQVARRRSLLRRQIGAVSDSVSFLIPRRDATGASQGPSESLVFMGQLFERVTEAGALVCELDSTEGLAKAHGVAVASPADPCSPRNLAADDMDFSRDLLMLRTDSMGNPRAESPSSLEKLMVSPLAWLLSRLHAEPSLWAPEAPGAALLGTVAHKVMEQTFGRGRPIPSATEIEASIEAGIETALRNLAPFLRGVQWRMEVRRFREALLSAAIHWREVLVRMDADILGNESWLSGTWSDIPLRGQSDLILGLPDDRLLVVDYKRSSSSKRVPQMEKGYDSQANLYRLMLETGGLKDAEDEGLNQRLKQARGIGIVYYFLNDRVALSDTEVPAAIAIPGWQAIGPDVSGRAMDVIKARLDEVRGGRLALNREGDRDRLKKEAGIEAYALNNSPLIPLFSVVDTEETAP